MLLKSLLQNKMNKPLDEIEEAAKKYVDQRYALLGYDYYFDPKIAIEAFKQGAIWARQELTKQGESTESAP